MSQLLFETLECHQESSPSTAEFGCIWVSRCGLGSCGQVGHSGLAAEGRGHWPFCCHSGLVSGVGYAPGHMVGAVCPIGLPSGVGTSSVGPWCWILSVGMFLWADSVRVGGLFWTCCAGLLLWVDGRFQTLWAVLWVFRWFRERFHGQLAIF